MNWESQGARQQCLRTEANRDRETQTCRVNERPTSEYLNGNTFVQNTSE